MKRLAPTEAGAVLVFALLVLVVGGTILGGIAQLAVTQSLAGRSEWESAARRIRLENSRALARQYVLSQMWRGFGGIAPGALGNSLTGGVGGFAITNVEPEFGYWLSLEQDNDERINPFNLFERGGFQSAWVSGFLRSAPDDSSNNIVPWGFQIRTRSPIAAGFAFVNHRPATNTWTPTPRIDLQQTNSDYAMGFIDLPRMPVSSVTNTNTGDTDGFRGFLLLPKAEADFGDVLADPDAGSVDLQMISSNSARVLLDLNIYDYDTTDGPRFYEVPAKIDITSGGSTNYALNVVELVLSNAAGTGTSFKTGAVQVVIPESNASLTSVKLAGSNMREVYLYRRGTNSPPLSIKTAGGNHTFRIGMTLDCPADLNISGTLTIRGGFRTGSLLTQSTGDFSLEAEPSPTWRLDAVADRMMWLEDQRER